MHAADPNGFVPVHFSINISAASLQHDNILAFYMHVSPFATFSFFLLVCTPSIIDVFDRADAERGLFLFFKTTNEQRERVFLQAKLVPSK